MALSRRASGRLQSSIWPGFVDAMTALLLVLMFVLTIFMVVQFVLRDTIDGQASELDDLGLEIAGLSSALGIERLRTADLQSDLSARDDALAAARSEADRQSALIATLNADLTEREAALAGFEAQVASLIAQRDEAVATGEALAASEAALLSERDALNLALASARDEVDAAAESARRAAAEADAFEALIADLRAESAATEATLAETLTALAAAESDAQDASSRLVTLAAALSEAEAGEADAEAARLAAAEALEEAEAARLAEAAAAEVLRNRLADTAAAVDEAEAARLAEAAAAERLRSELAEAQGEIESVDTARLAEAAAAEALRARLENADAEITAMTLRLEEARAEAEETLTLLAAARAATEEAEIARDTALTDAQEEAALLAMARSDLAAQEALTAQEALQVEALNQQVADLRGQIGTLQNLLDISEAQERQADIQIESLGSRLNAALARAAAEATERARLEEAERRRLERSVSNFFGTVREVFEDRDDVRVVGDRFVFSSEVLFEPGSATLSFQGRRQIADIARTIREVADAIPDTVDWVLRVDGHTDDLPLSGTGAFADNWELSQARALSVVRYMSEDLGLPPSRLAANGFGQYRPIDPGDTPEARARNRRIELKFTER